MGFYYRCDYCHETHLAGTRCPKKPTFKRAKGTKSDKFYRSANWKRIRNLVKTRQNYVDVWLLGKENILKQVDVGIVHHIEEYKENVDLALDVSNLVYVSIESHNEIHEYYQTFRKDEAIAIIQQGKERLAALYDNS